MTPNQENMKQWVKQAGRKLPSWPHSLRVINEQLWCCCQDVGIVVFDGELQQQRTIPADDIGYVCDVAEMSNGDVVIATDEGLYYSSNGRLQNLNSCSNLKYSATAVTLLFLRKYV